MTSYPAPTGDKYLLMTIPDKLRSTLKEHYQLQGEAQTPLSRTLKRLLSAENALQHLAAPHSAASPGSYSAASFGSYSAASAGSYSASAGSYSAASAGSYSATSAGHYSSASAARCDSPFASSAPKHLGPVSCPAHSLLGFSPLIPNTGVSPSPPSSDVSIATRSARFAYVCGGSGKEGREGLKGDSKSKLEALIFGPDNTESVPSATQMLDCLEGPSPASRLEELIRVKDALFSQVIDLLLEELEGDLKPAVRQALGLQPEA